MKTLLGSLIVGLLLASCGKEEAAPEPKKAAVAPKPAAAPVPPPEKKLPPVPQGKLPQMHPDKAKFIAVPNTPKDEEVKKAAPPIDPAKK